MQVLRDAESMRAFTRQHRKSGRSVALVPTMGFLHAGHLSLIREAKQHADIVVVSIYVNPTQFAAHEDFGVYPRSVEDDHEKLAHLHVDAVFEPASLYARVGNAMDNENVIGAAQRQHGAHETFVEVQQLQKGLCGDSRPHFFRGVATVVAKLFNIVEPDVAVFGQKDYQQWRVICRMVRDLDFPIQIIGVPTEREADGLAMSSRNALLTPQSRQQAPAIYQSLQWAVNAVAEGEASSAGAIKAEIRRRLADAGGVVDYVEVVDAENLNTVEDLRKQPTLLAVAVKFGSVRLIDNIVIHPKVNSCSHTHVCQRQPCTAGLKVQTGCLP
ncbi:hypothetical protein WJX72_009131 [[Myrmecia] bisecta]|uniref:Pantoate--beta-alanine ligase n=1 Tax=[Myrmecia] bisecta TaxID=41462 RepID=A0AAW1PMA5_9CHLO